MTGREWRLWMACPFRQWGDIRVIRSPTAPRTSQEALVLCSRNQMGSNDVAGYRYFGWGYSLSEVTYLTTAEAQEIGLRHVDLSSHPDRWDMPK